ncbi:MAG: helix-hairpin-helix domain-containing protein [Chloroflexi bacterium]|nr:helix-hairpin-helix domain-containing protein [Chloroflexota bacterium]
MLRVLSQIILILSLIAALAGGVVLIIRQSSNRPIEILLPSPTPSPEIKIYITGGVRDPGVYTIYEGDRLIQAIRAAGGPTDDADLERVNLAAKVQDEDHWHIPKLGEVSAPVQTTRDAGKIDLNAATLEMLESLPGIGQVKAKAIISYRETKGKFSSLEDLLKVQGIGSSTLDAIRDLITVR